MALRSPFLGASYLFLKQNAGERPAVCFAQAHRSTRTAVAGHIHSDVPSACLSQFTAKFRNSLRLTSTFHILGRQYIESTTKNLIINTSPFYSKLLLVLSIYWEDNIWKVLLKNYSKMD